MNDESSTDDGLRARFSRQGEETLGRIAQELLENPLVSGALQRTFEARERAAQAQEAAMGALNLPSAADLERLTRRVRSVGQRLEGIEDGVDRLADRLSGGQGAGDAARLEALEKRLASLDEALAKIAASVSALGPEESAAADGTKAAKRAAGATPSRRAGKAKPSAKAAKPKPPRASAPRKPAA